MNVKRLTVISMVALLLGHTMVNTYFPNLMINAVGLFVTSAFIFYFTLRKNDLFSFVMVMYFCTLFPYLLEKGGGFNLVALLNVLIYFLLKRKLPSEFLHSGKSFNRLVILLLISSILGWCINFVGSKVDLLVSISSFLGILALLVTSSRIIWSEYRIITFLKLNLVLIIYSILVSANKFLNIIPINTHMFPQYGSGEIQMGNIESGGIIGSSPYYGQHSMIVAMLFATFFIISFLSKNYIVNKKFLFIGLFIAIVNVFFSVSKAVLFITIGGIGLIYLLQNKIIRGSLFKQLRQLVVISLLGFLTIYVIKAARLDYVFRRVEIQNQINQDQGGFTVDRILDGTALNRGYSYEEAFKRYRSRNWLIGYGYGLPSNNRHAFYVDVSIKQGSAHSQIFAVLFIFGWLGFIAFWGLHIFGIWKSFKLAGNKLAETPNRLYAVFAIVMIAATMAHGVTADSISYPSYFGSTMILLGLAFANIHSIKYLKI